MFDRIRPSSLALAGAFALGAGFTPAAQAWPPDVAVVMAITYKFDEGPVIALRTGPGIDLIRAPGELPHTDRFSATIGTEFHVTPLVYGELARVFQKSALRASFTDTTIAALPLGFTNLTFALNNGAELLLELGSSTPQFRAYSELIVDPGLPALPGIGFDFPLMRYQYQSPIGPQLRELGLSLHLLSDPARCTPTDCTFDRGYWDVTVSAVPEPTPSILLSVGLATLLALSARRAPGFRQRAA